MVSVGMVGLCAPLAGDEYTNKYLTSNKHNSGCVIRIKKDGSIPEGNLPSHIKPKACWARGLRNGWASTWDKGRFIVAELVAITTGSHEDIHIVDQGEHLGWPHCEGHCWEWSSCRCKKHDDPIYSYAHNCGGAALIGVGVQSSAMTGPRSTKVATSSRTLAWLDQVGGV